MAYEQDLLDRAITLTKSASQVLDDARAAVDQLQHAGPASIELRHDEKGRFDELVGRGCSVHLEDMGGHWCLIVSAPGLRAMVSITSKKAVVYETEGPVRVTP